MAKLFDQGKKNQIQNFLHGGLNNPDKLLESLMSLESLGRDM